MIFGFKIKYNNDEEKLDILIDKYNKYNINGFKNNLKNNRIFYNDNTDVYVSNLFDEDLHAYFGSGCLLSREYYIPLMRDYSIL